MVTVRVTCSADVSVAGTCSRERARRRVARIPTGCEMSVCRAIAVLLVLVSRWVPLERARLRSAKFVIRLRRAARSASRCGVRATSARGSFSFSARIRLPLCEIRRRLMRFGPDESGMSTAEYAIGTIAAAAFGAVLYGVVTGDSIVDALTKIIDKALSTSV